MRRANNAVDGLREGSGSNASHDDVRGVAIGRSIVQQEYGVGTSQQPLPRSSPSRIVFRNKGSCAAVNENLPGRHMARGHF